LRKIGNRVMKIAPKKEPRTVPTPSRDSVPLYRYSVPPPGRKERPPRFAGGCAPTACRAAPPFLSAKKEGSFTTFIQQDDKRGVIMLCYQEEKSPILALPPAPAPYHCYTWNLFLPRITHRPSFLYPVSTPFISRASHPSARGPNRVVVNDTQLTIATAHRVWYDGKQPQPERLVDESGPPDHLRPTCKG
jgi:hypothetical protein